MTKAGQLRLDSVTKLFGRDPASALDHLAKGKSRAEIFAETGLIVALHDVSFAVSPGECFVVMGLSGSGKSTLARCINRLVEPTSGRIYLDDLEITALSPDRLLAIRRHRIGMVFQDFGLLPHRTVWENVSLAFKIRGEGDQEEAVSQAFELVGLTEWADRYPDELSGGMQQRVGVARALAAGTDVLLMDEPFSSLDRIMRYRLQTELVQIQRLLRRTVLFVTHDLSEALRLGDRIAIMRDGSIVQIDTPAGILFRPANSFVAEFTSGVDVASALTVATIMRRPIPILPGEPAAAVRARLEAVGRSHGVLIDEDGRPRGLVKAAALVEDEPVTLEAVPPVLSVSASQTVASVFAELAEQPLLAVVDQSGRHAGDLNARISLAAVAAAGRGKAGS